MLEDQVLVDSPVVVPTQHEGVSIRRFDEPAAVPVRQILEHADLGCLDIEDGQDLRERLPMHRPDSSPQSASRAVRVTRFAPLVKERCAPYRRMMDRPELVHGIGLTTDIPATVERTLGCLSRA